MNTPDTSTPEADRTDDATQAADQRDSQTQGQADRPPTEKEERIAAEHADAADGDVAEHYEEMAKTGAEVEGEGRIDP